MKRQLLQRNFSGSCMQIDGMGTKNLLQCCGRPRPLTFRRSSVAPRATGAAPRLTGSTRWHERVWSRGIECCAEWTLFGRETNENAVGSQTVRERRRMRACCATGRGGSCTFPAKQVGSPSECSPSKEWDGSQNPPRTLDQGRRARQFGRIINKRRRLPRSRGG